MQSICGFCDIVTKGHTICKAGLVQSIWKARIRSRAPSCRFSISHIVKDSQVTLSPLSGLLTFSLSSALLAAGILMCLVMPDNYLHYLLLLTHFTHKYSEGVLSSFNYLLPPTFPQELPEINQGFVITQAVVILQHKWSGQNLIDKAL